MRFALTLVISATVGVFTGPPCAAQTRLTSPEELQRELSAGDVITVMPASGQRVSGRVLRQTAAGLEIRPAGQRDVRGAALRDVTIPLDAIQWLERPRDPVWNGLIIGTSTGAAAGGAMFLTAFVIDRNEMDEWAPFYLGATVVCAGIGALIGWTVDAANSKPYLIYRASPGGRTTVGIRPLRSHGLGIGLAVAF